MLFTKKSFLLSTAFLSFALVGNAQNTHHIHTEECAVNAANAALIKERMLQNRARVDPAQIDAIQANRTITYIPITFHIIGDNNGDGYEDLDEVLDMFCTVNNDYLDQDIQFYINGQFRYINNSTLYNNAFSIAAGNVMNSNKVSNSMNVYVGPSVQDPAASFYQPGWATFGDYVFMLSAQTDGAGRTATHEFGHFFTLPHTFDGWEDTNYDDVYGVNSPNGIVNNAPNTMGGVTVERVARTGSSANCAAAGDGFCDTEADYFSSRIPCPYTNAALDPTGVQLDPDETNFMSYFFDACVNTFSTEQKDAIMADVISRGWLNFTPPTTATITSAPTLISPVNNDVIGVGGSGNLTLQWDAVPGATAYYLEIDRSFNSSPIEEIERVVVYGSTSYSLPYSSFEALKQYSWRVRPFNSSYTCTSNFDATHYFITTSDVASNIVTTNSGNLSMQILGNPVTDNVLDIQLDANQTTTAAISIYSIDGKRLAHLNTERVEAGENNFQMDVSSLSNGLYVAVITTEEGTIQQKWTLNR